ncbi:MAG TPA: ribosome assembly RNA-binding protein YhbY [Candidatus Jeotgalibaca merdavium]|jgi:RNA-binding protein|uniref:Ribosome assembly RNA-binding protein YhbY n=2 Tax=Jeotgalibaca TaxID=1470540 RepID=A0A6G7KBE9_9LACT|nr:ribosome assembly RNA-binding protein YhbY [Jeotgalibaca arthritidis]QII82567.1 ribosome assembly RNA-binding protein YhbY [Jeotgalibaca arthritidis]HJA89945.1 ribosome assembly RNA-binding protein YhbY [Candidatus Jeotgalibaca merdavium]
MELRGKQKQFLKKEAHHLQAIFQIGKGGLSDEIVRQIDEALEKRELIKVSLLQNTDEVAADVAVEVAERVGAVVVQQIGKTIIFFRESSKEKNQRLSLLVKKI